MQNKYIVSKRADLDMMEIGDFIALDNKDASSKLIDEFTNSFRRLAQMPKSGYKKQEWTFDENIRFCSVKRYMIVYKIDKENITILRVLSSYRNIEDLLENID